MLILRKVIPDRNNLESDNHAASRAIGTAVLHAKA
jgi:hypothetical protein